MNAISVHFVAYSVAYSNKLDVNSKPEYNMYELEWLSACSTIYNWERESSNLVKLFTIFVLKAQESHAE